jgi:hypothetical protein
MIVKPFSSVVKVTPGGSDGICIAEARVENVVSLIKQNRTGRIWGNKLWAIQFGSANEINTPTPAPPILDSIRNP